MQNTEGQQNGCEWLRDKDKDKNNRKVYKNLIHGSEQVPKGVMQKQVKVKWQ